VWCPGRRKSTAILDEVAHIICISRLARLVSTVPALHTRKRRPSPNPSTSTSTTKFNRFINQQALRGLSSPVSVPIPAENNLSNSACVVKVILGKRITCGSKQLRPDQCADVATVLCGEVQSVARRLM
jgi:hypothetical protein